ncbi:hypothetical protein C7Y69_03695 [Alteromonas sp. KS69]|jgi:site-specific recombinase XerD|nr:hypothetical protein C7Y69_03695 [Alteromonas sp. KS69]
MQNRSPTYLYKFKNSSNYFFRIRYGNFDQTCHVCLKDKYFVASLGTTDYDTARWLALYIKCNLIKDKDVNMIDVDRNTHNQGVLSKGATVDPAETLACIGELTPFPEEYTPQYLLAQQLYKKQLKDKYRLLLAAGKEIINHGVATQLGALDSMKEDALNSATSDLSRFCDVNTRRELVDILLPHQPIKNIQKPEVDNRYVRGVKMLNELMAALSRENRKFDTFDEVYECEDSPIASSSATFTQEQLLSGMVDMISLLPMFRTIKEKATEKATPTDVVENTHFSLFGQMDKFLNEKQGTIADRTIDKYKASFSLLKEIWPDDSDVRDWKKQKVQEVKTALTQRKSNQSKNCNDRPMSITTKNMYLSNYRTLFSWIIENTDADIKNPFANSAFQKARGKSKPPTRRSFTVEEVRKILRYKPEHGSEAKTFRNDAKWYLKVCLYSSMRLNELSALPVANIKQIDDVWCFDLRGLDLKNEASERVIPIAQYLLNEGILDYVEMLKKHKEEFFCPQIRHGKAEPSSAGWGDPISRWFSRTVLKKVGIDKDKEEQKGTLICFHCTRRTFISTCINNGVEKYLVKRLAGHSIDDDITLSVYSDVDKIDLNLLKSVIDKNLKWHEINLG